MIKSSNVVPTEYDVSTEPRRLGRSVVVLIDDRSRRFTGRTLDAAFRRAEQAQDPSDPIHHPPYPAP
jgi:hypothetical protein